MKYMLKILKWFFLALFGFFAVTFTVYYLALDSKLIRKIMPLLTNWYDEQDKKRERLL